MRRLAVYNLIASIILASHVTWAADTEFARSMQGKYIHLMHHKAYREAFELIVLRKEAGDGWARGYFDDWFHGDATKEMKDVIEEWLEQSARAGKAEAQMML